MTDIAIVQADVGPGYSDFEFVREDQFGELYTAVKEGKQKVLVRKLMYQIEKQELQEIRNKINKDDYLHQFELIEPNFVITDLEGYKSFSDLNKAGDTGRQVPLAEFEALGIIYRVN